MDLIYSVWTFREALPRSVTIEEARLIYAERNGINEKDVIDNAESLADLTARQRAFIEFVSSHVAPKESISIDDQDNNQILVVTHGAFIRNFLTSFCGLESIRGIANCGVTKVHVEVNSSGITCSIPDETLVNYSMHLDDTELKLNNMFCS